jgi:hypothetical protein
LFLFQVLNYARSEAQQPRHRVERRSLSQGELIAVKSLLPHGKYTLLALDFFLEKGPGRFETAGDTAVLRNWSREGLEDLAREAGLEPLESYGGFDRAPFDPSASADLIALLGKA